MTVPWTTRNFRAAVLTIFLSVSPAAWSVEFLVNSVADLVDDNTNDGLCHTSANTCTLRAAIMQANHLTAAGYADITVPGGTYVLSRAPAGADGEDSGDLNLTTPLHTGQLIAITGAGAGRTIIDANLTDRAFRIDATRQAFLGRMTIRNGYPRGANASGGAVSHRGAYLSIGDSVFENNRSDFDGGAIDATGSLSISRSTFRGNVARYGGGALFVSGATWLRESTLVANVANNGGGIASSYQIYLLQSTLSANVAYTNGGGIANGAGGTAFLYNATVVDNDADHDHDENGGNGGGVYNEAGSRFGVVNALIARNTMRDTPQSDDCYGTLEAYGRTLLGDTLGCASSNATLGLVSPGSIGPLGNHGGPTLTHALLAGSQAINSTIDAVGCVDDAGDPLDTDQRGAPRRINTRCDVGAFEYGGVVDTLFDSNFDY